MAPSPEYDKEPKAPDKSATNISSEDSKLLHNLVNDQHNNSDHKTTNTTANSEVENNKHVETLDDDKLRALLNEALTYKCPKDREGKSSLFKELLEEVEQDDQAACEAAARTLTGCRGSRRGARGGGRPALPHSNSLQDLVAALAAEPAPHARRHRHHAPGAHHHAAGTVAARAHHGGSLPSGVDTSSMLSEEGGGGSRGGAGGAAGYLATVRCVNPPPLAERRVSASDANAPIDLELLNRRSKPTFPMTYTARATLEIGSGSVCSGRAVTTTTASNQVRTSPQPPASASAPAAYPRDPDAPPAPLPAQARLLSAIRSPETRDAGGGCVEAAPRGKAPRGPRAGAPPPPRDPTLASRAFVQSVDSWYEGLVTYRAPPAPRTMRHEPEDGVVRPRTQTATNKRQHSDKHKKNESLYTDIYDSGRRHSERTVYRVVERQKYCDSEKSDISIRKTYREIILPKFIPKVPPINPRNIRNMSIGEPSSSFENLDTKIGYKLESATHVAIDRNSSKVTNDEVISHDPTIQSNAKEVPRTDLKTTDTRIEIESEISETMEAQTSKCFQMSDVSSRPRPTECARARGAGRAHAPLTITDTDDIELEEIVCHRATDDNRDTGSFSHYLADQEKLFQVLEATDSLTTEDEYTVTVVENNNHGASKRTDDEEAGRDVSSETDTIVSTCLDGEKLLVQEGGARSDELAVRATRREDKAPDRYILAELPNNAYVFLTLPKRLVAPVRSARRPELAALEEAPTKSKRKKDKPPVGSSSCAKRKDAIDKNALRALLFENLLKSDKGSATRAPAGADTEVDSAIPFSCITTPEVVASCNTTPSAAHTAAAHAAHTADPKPQGEEAATSPAPAPAPPPPAAHPLPPEEQPRSVISSSFNGLPLARPGYGATPTTSGDDYKVPTHTIVPLLPSFVKSLDENGNSVQGYGSPLSGSSQHKKPRRKKSSKNETVIDCRQLDGYQGHKDVNELLRFIESDRAPKLRKPKDDSDDKGKKRSADRRKQHEHKPARASSLEELSRTTIEELTARAPPAKPERRSWGDAAPAPAAPPDPPPPAEHADFQTVTKKRKPRRRTEEAAPRRTRAPSPPAAASAPPSDRSNDSNDDMDSVHSLPERAAPAPGAVPPAHHASYADIARTRHNIPDLIESCNFYTESEGGRRRVEPAAARPQDVDGYPALDGRTEPAPTAAAVRRTTRDKPSPPVVRRKERPLCAAAGTPAADCPAPDVVSDRRPPVILLDSASRPRDMDGVTFGFDINEQLLGGGARRPRCDLVRDAVEAPTPAAAAGVPVRTAKRALRYVPPPPPPDHTQLHQIIDFVGGAWEDVVRCGGGKVHYFSESR